MVAAIQEACDREKIAHPDIVTEAGRAMVAHHSVLIFDVLGVHEMLSGKPPEPVAEDDHKVLKDLAEIWSSISQKNVQEAYHDALQLKEEAATLFSLGYLDLRGRARVERLFWDCCEKILRIVREHALRARRARRPREGSRRHLLRQLLRVPVGARPLGRQAALPDHADPPARTRSPRAAASSPTSPATATARSTSSSTCAT